MTFVNWRNPDARFGQRVFVETLPGALKDCIKFSQFSEYKDVNWNDAVVIHPAIGKKLFKLRRERSPVCPAIRSLKRMWELGVAASCVTSDRDRVAASAPCILCNKFSSTKASSSSWSASTATVGAADACNVFQCAVCEAPYQQLL